ncbi:MAG: two-component sensor histidine kinase [Acidimicrobiales bacterium]|nr:MAG: two-component sensor histidine kinase [Acidimicrobiales bacterium]
MRASAGDPEPAPKRRLRFRWTVRLRLTAAYGVLFLMAGAGLLVVSTSLVRASLVAEEGRGGERAAAKYGLDPKGVRQFLDLVIPGGPYVDEEGNSAVTIGDVIEGVQRDMREDTLDEMVRGSVVALACMFLVALGFGWVMAGRVLRPVARLTATARSLSERNLSERISLEGPDDELKELAETLDRMLDRLQAAFESQRRFAAEVSHELRTPLTIIRGEAELSLADPAAGEREKELARRVREAAVRSERLIESLLALARSESTMTSADVVDLADLAGDVVGDRVEDADRHGVAVSLELNAAPVRGDRWLLERLVANLVENAIVHNNDGGWMRVEVCCEDGHGKVLVSNSGRCYSPDEVRQIFEPFRRLGERNGSRREGFGLGMAIVRSVAEAHGGLVEAHPLPDGGLEVSVRFPLASPHPGREA